MTQESRKAQFGLPMELRSCFLQPSFQNSPGKLPTAQVSLNSCSNHLNQKGFKIGPRTDVISCTAQSIRKPRGIFGSCLWRANETSSFLVTPYSEGQARFSADGRWVAYTSTESGRAEIYVRPFAAPGGSTPTASGGKWMVSNG